MGNVYVICIWWIFIKIHAFSLRNIEFKNAQFSDNFNISCFYVMNLTLFYVHTLSKISSKISGILDLEFFPYCKSDELIFDFKNQNTSDIYWINCGNVVKCEHFLIREEGHKLSKSCQRSSWMLPWPINWMTFPFGQVHFINSTANHYSHISIFLHKSFSRSEKNEIICKHKSKEVHLWYEIKEQWVQIHNSLKLTLIHE